MKRTFTNMSNHQQADDDEKNTRVTKKEHVCRECGFACEIPKFTYGTDEEYDIDAFLEKAVGQTVFISKHPHKATISRTWGEENNAYCHFEVTMCESTDRYKFVMPIDGRTGDFIFPRPMGNVHLSSDFMHRFKARVPFEWTCAANLTKQSSLYAFRHHELSDFNNISRLIFQMADKPDGVTQ
jgi:hypothetical protein